MFNILSTANNLLLFLLPVPIARKYLNRAYCKVAQLIIIDRDRQLLIDVSVIINNDGRTGIQRVVRALLLQLLSQPPVGWRVRPVFATRKQGYCYAPDQYGYQDNSVTSLRGENPVNVLPGDIFLGLDFASRLLPIHRNQLAQWKRSGAEIHIIVYDLLPVLYPHWFNSKTTKHFQRWIRNIAIISDSFICISNTVKIELGVWLNRKYFHDSGNIPISTIPMGADIESSAPSHGLPENVNHLLAELFSKPTVLMVGTLEPRKGHSQVLAAFEKLWQQSRDINLVIVGKAGWKTEELQQRLRSHPQQHIRLHWLENASDELLELLYVGCTGVIVASHAEGFGLPLIEAKHHNKPVLARDIPVFREIAGEYATFFSDEFVDNLDIDIEGWLGKVCSMRMPEAVKQLEDSWHDSAKELLNRLGVVQGAFGRPAHPNKEGATCL